MEDKDFDVAHVATRRRAPTLLRRLNVGVSGQSPYRARPVRKHSNGRRKTVLLDPNPNGMLPDLLDTDAEIKEHPVDSALKHFEILWVPAGTHLSHPSPKPQVSTSGGNLFNSLEEEENDKATACWVLLEGSVQLGLPEKFGNNRDRCIQSMIDQLHVFNGRSTAEKSMRISLPPPKTSRSRPSLSINFGAPSGGAQRHGVSCIPAVRLPSLFMFCVTSVYGNTETVIDARCAVKCITCKQVSHRSTNLPSLHGPTLGSQDRKGLHQSFTTFRWRRGC